ncbi:hypothetical protein [Haloechinothrix halophila]|uniref:hypothetical protein n=1 Tax=Haloechinothrix halophila TaxID=1069073 RepID=UPI00040E95ED|nr:hypothetical protein [Haloechinothrix halophila]
MRAARSLAAGVMIAALFTTTSATASDQLPGQPLDAGHAYIFTQQHRDNLYWWNDTWTPQTVPSGAHLQVQLPSDPVRWVPERGGHCQPSPVADLVPTWLVPLRADVELTGRTSLPNEGRMPESSRIAVFDYRVDGVGIAAVCLRAETGGEPGSHTPADYVLTLVVGVPQISLP